MTPNLKANYQQLAIEVIRRAVADVTPKKDWVKREPVSPLDRESARRFLDNSDELAFFADMAGLTETMKKAGYFSFRGVIDKTS